MLWRYKLFLSIFSSFFTKTYVENIERISNNEEIARYEFLARSSIGDEIRCTIYLANEWNIPQISLSGFVAPRDTKKVIIKGYLSNSVDKKFRLWPDRIKRIFEDKNLKILFFLYTNLKTIKKIDFKIKIIYNSICCLM